MVKSHEDATPKDNLEETSFVSAAHDSRTETAENLAEPTRETKQNDLKRRISSSPGEENNDDREAKASKLNDDEVEAREKHEEKQEAGQKHESLDLGSYRFEAAPVVEDFEGLLFDLDGTIVDSTSAIEKHWQRLGKQLGVDPEEILATSHGRRSIDTLELYDPKLANWEYVSQIEGRIPRDYGQDAVVLPGSRELLGSLDEEATPWAIVTSGTRALLTGWMDVMKMVQPKQTVVAEDVSRGKPDPTCYQMGRDRLGLSEEASCLVLEDSPSGIKAGKAAGFRVVAVATTHRIDQLQEAGADWVVRDLSSVKLRAWDEATGKASIQISKALVT